MKKLVPLVLLVYLAGCKKSQNEPTVFQQAWSHDYQTISQLGDTLRSAPPAEKTVAQYESKRDAYEAEPENLDNLIWYGRFAAYMGNYREAVAIYTHGLEVFGENSRLLRHRGHRYITLREFDKAIADLSRAAQLIEGKVNKVEEDGMPNDQNIPVSTQHGNIYYHLGLAYYLDRQVPKALDAFKHCLQTSSSADNVVAATHWIYMIQNRLGRQQAAKNYLRNIVPDMPVIENHSYYKACLFYKGLIGLDSLYNPNAATTASNSAMAYAAANWMYYTGNRKKAAEIFEKIMSGTDWASFGYIAAETDLAKPYVSR